jgi:hypothetical protein
MENTQHTKTKKGQGSKVDTSGDSTKSGLVAVMGKGVSMSLSRDTSATISNASKKTWTSAELVELRLKAGLVAGALADFQTAGGVVVVKNVEYEPGKFFPKLYLVAEGLNIKLESTPDGLDFDVQPLPSGTVAEVE